MMNEPPVFRVADVRRAMQWFRPDAVVAEVCIHREDGLHDDDDEDDDPCEFRAALEESQDLPDCRFVPGDRCHRVTDKRAWNVIGTGEICRIAKHIARLMLRGEARRVFDSISEVFTGTYDYADDIYEDQAKRRAYDVCVDSLIREIFPEWWKAVMTERDLYMTHMLHEELEWLIAARYEDVNTDLQPVRIVAVVGRAHVDGIKTNWGKVNWVDDEVIDELWRYAN
ncbi:traB domain-containing protein-like protein [Aphelenchoides avenae]|nr:traB domain-containing protein-like protein [Aphelenchus avenae]